MIESFLLWTFSQTERESVCVLPLKSAGDVAVPLVKVFALLHINAARSFFFNSHPLRTSVVSVDG